MRIDRQLALGFAAVFALAPLTSCRKNLESGPGGSEAIDAVEAKPGASLPARVTLRIGQASRLNNPRSVALDARGNLYVADTGNGRIVKFDSSGREVARIGKRGANPGEFAEPWIVAVSPRDEIVVLDRESAWIQVFTSEGELVRRFGGPKAGFYYPGGMAVAPDGTVAVADTGGNRIVLLDSEGQGAKSISLVGKRTLQQPTDVVTDAHGGLYVLQPSPRPEVRSLLFHLNEGGGYGEAWWVAGAPSTRDTPRVARAADGRLYVSAPGGQIHVYTADGKESRAIAIGGPEAAPLKRVTGLAVDAAGSLYLVDADAGLVYRLHLTG